MARRRRLRRPVPPQLAHATPGSADAEPGGGTRTIVAITVETPSEWAPQRAGSGRLSREVRDELLKEMRAGAFPDGKLPPEAQLAKDLGISRATVRAALQSLADDGIVTRRRRHGTVINEQVLRGRVSLNRFASFRELVEQSGYACTVEPTVRRVGVPDDEVAGLLGVAPSEPCLIVERLLRADDEPAVTVTDTVPLDLVDGEVGALADTDSTFAFIAQNTRATVDHATLEIVPSVAGADGPRHLALPAGTPYAELRELLFSPGGDPVAFSRIAVDARRIRLTLARRDV